MRKIMCNRAAAIYFDYKNAKPSYFHDVIEKRNIGFKLERKSFCGFKYTELLDHCSCYTETRNFDFVLFHLNAVMLNQRRFNT